VARLALIGVNYAPEVTGIAVNTVDWANQLTESGHEVTVLTGMPSYPEWRVQDLYRGHLRLEETIGGVSVDGSTCTSPQGSLFSAEASTN
jgi:colanic acid biosynthesis glycosyl transferase WcaI